MCQQETKSTVSKALVSVIIPSWSGYPLLKKTLPYFSKIRDPKQIVVVDPDPFTVKRVKEEFPFCDVYRLEKNYGVAGNTNKALEHANGEYILVTQNDFFVNPDFVQVALRFIQQNPDVAMVGGYFIQNRKVHPSLKPPKISNKPFLNTLCTLARTDVIKELNGLDSYTMIGSEDVDLSIRCMMKGFKISMINSIAGHHSGSSSVRRFRFRGTYEILKSRLYVTLKWNTRNSIPAIICDLKREVKYILLNLRHLHRPKGQVRLLAYLLALLTIPKIAWDIHKMRTESPWF